MQSYLEKRKERRLSVNLPASLVAENGLARLPVTIVNVSPSGAMFELDHPAPLPGTFTLLFDHKMQPCHLVWQKTRFAGAQFDAA